MARIPRNEGLAAVLQSAARMAGDGQPQYSAEGVSTCDQLRMVCAAPLSENRAAPPVAAEIYARRLSKHSAGGDLAARESTHRSHSSRGRAERARAVSRPAGRVGRRAITRFARGTLVCRLAPGADKSILR